MSNKVILKGKHVILRSLSLKDAPRFCRWLADHEVTKFLSSYGQPPPTLTEERQWIKVVQQRQGSINLAIDTASGVHIGSTSLRNYASPSKRGLFGIMIGDKKYWGQGLGTEVTRLMVEYGFRALKLHRIYLQLIAYNIRAQKAYQRVGFRVEGRFRDHIYRDGYYHDVVWMGVLQEEYFRKSKGQSSNVKSNSKAK